MNIAMAAKVGVKLHRKHITAQPDGQHIQHDIRQWHESDNLLSATIEGCSERLKNTVPCCKSQALVRKPLVEVCRLIESIVSTSWTPTFKQRHECTSVAFQSGVEFQLHPARNPSSEDSL